MSITVPIRKGATFHQRPQPKPQFQLMAAAQMAKEGKFAQDPQAQSSDALTSIQPQEGIGQ